MAPEVICNGEYSPAGDVYAFGVTLLALLTKQKVFVTLTPQAIMQKVGYEGLTPTIPDELLDTQTRPKWIPEALIGVINRCLEHNAAQRPTMKEICDILKAV